MAKRAETTPEFWAALSSISHPPFFISGRALFLGRFQFLFSEAKCFGPFVHKPQFLLRILDCVSLLQPSLFFDL
jgi:hypothetical protein